MEEKEFHIGRLAAVNAAKFGDKAAMKYRIPEKGLWKPISWKEVNERSYTAAKALIALGIKPQDKVAIYAQNMVDMMIADLAVQQIRAIAVPLYATSSAEQVEYIVNDAGCEVMFVGEQYQYDQAIKVLHSSSVLKRIITIAPEINLNGVDVTMMFADFLKHGEGDTHKAEYDKRQADLNQNDLATLIYTSGTTGEPKGVMIAHSNYTHQMLIHEKVLPMCDETKTSLMFLPASHIFERAWDYFCMYRGMLIYVNTNPKEITQSLVETRPVCMCAVPRLWEKVYAGVQEKIEKFPFLTRTLMRHAVKIGRKRNIDCVRIGKDVPLLVELQYNIFSHTLFNLVKKKLGVENSELFPVAGSALSETVQDFLISIGFPICSGYGLTESCATVSCCQPGKVYTIGSVGQVMPGAEVRIGDNNEILIKAPFIAKGYYNKPEATEQTFGDGWFHTGDAGRMENGELYITERIKDLFKTSNGKYIAPQQIENILEADKYIEQSAVIGDQRKFVSALIVPAFDALKEYAEMNKIEYNSIEELLKNEKIIIFYEGRLSILQQKLAAYEQVKRFTLMPKAFTLDTGELTPTLKLKRKVIYSKFANEIEYMYSY